MLLSHVLTWGFEPAHRRSLQCVHEAFWSVQVSTGVTLRENNLKEIEGGHILDSQGILVGSRRALRERPGLLEVCAWGWGPACFKFWLSSEGILQESLGIATQHQRVLNETTAPFMSTAVASCGCVLEPARWQQTPLRTTRACHGVKADRHHRLGNTCPPYSMRHYPIAGRAAGRGDAVHH